MSDESGRYEVYVQAFPEPKKKWQISNGAGSGPKWGVRGEELFYIASNGKLMSVRLKLGADSVEPSAPRELFSPPGPYELMPDGKRFVVLAPLESGPRPLQVILNWLALLKKSSPPE
jgi:hypothetical protein